MDPTQTGLAARFVRLHASELLIFVVLAVVLAMCIAAVPLVADRDS